LLKHRYQQLFIIFPDAETPLFSAFHFFPSPKTLQSAISSSFSFRNNSVQHLFRLSPSVAETPLSATFLVAETPLSATFHFLPVAETPLPATLHHCFDAETPCSAL
jgi:hypothetical protein